MTLTVAMIARDEAALLGRCLASVQGLADEVVLVDTGSADATVEIARAHGARVGTFPWTDDFSAARNASLDLATGDWVLVLDADEALDPRDHGAFRAAMEAPGAQAYRVLIRNYLPTGNFTMMDGEARANPGGPFDGRDFPFCADTRAVRLFRNHPWARFTCRIHEMVDPAFQARGIPLPGLDAVIHHLGFTLADRAEAKKPRYLDLARRDAEERPGDYQAQFHLLLQAAAAHAWPLALEAADRCLALVPAGAPTVTLTRGTALQRLERHGEAAVAFADHLAVHPGNVPAAHGLAVSLEFLGKREEAKTILEALVREHPAYATPALDLADLLVRAGEREGARAALARAVAASPRDPALRGRLVRLGLEAGDPDLAVRDAWEALGACGGTGDPAWPRLVGLHLLRAGAREEALAVLALGLEAFPGNAELLRLKEMA